MSNKRKYYIVEWIKDCRDTLHQLQLYTCYKTKYGYIDIYDWIGIRKDYCFPVKKINVFTDLEKAKGYALEKLDIMYISRCKHLIKERDEAIDKIKKMKG